MKQPEDVQLSREEGEALIERIERNALSAEDRRVLVKICGFPTGDRAAPIQFEHDEFARRALHGLIELTQ
jgi:hypothetical protein